MRSKAIEFRRIGHSIPEISLLVGVSKSTVLRWVKDVAIEEEYIDTWRSKQGGSKIGAQARWNIAGSQVRSLLPSSLGLDHYLLIASCLYWGEGNKEDFTFSNSDPEMVRVVIACLRYFSLATDDIKITIRIYEDMVSRQEEIQYFWIQKLGLPSGTIVKFTVLSGKKEGKLLFGMCRLRIRKGGKYLKLLQSTVSHIKSINL